MINIEKLENSGALVVLIVLYKNNNKMYLSKLRKEASIGIGTLNSRIFNLKELDLIEEEVEDKFGGRRYIWLTPKGKKIAEKLLEINQIMEKEK